MDFESSDKVKLLISQIERFMDEQIYPNEDLARRQIEESGDEHHFPAILKELQGKAKALGDVAADKRRRLSRREPIVGIGHAELVLHEVLGVGSLAQIVVVGHRP